MIVGPLSTGPQLVCSSTLAVTFRLLWGPAELTEAGSADAFPDCECRAELSCVGPAAKQLGRFPMAQTGVVKFFNGERGYGFIKPDDGGRDVFVHITAVEQAGLKGLNEGQRISFDVEPDKKGKGPKAVNLVVTG